jgi:hypothetical protein
MEKSIIITRSSRLLPKRYLNFLFCSLMVISLQAACSIQATPSTTPTRTIALSETRTSTVAPPSTPSPTWTVSPSPSVVATRTTTPTLTPTLSPMEMFVTRLLRPGVLPQTYLEDNCSFLQMRWSPKSSQPGTVVVPIMFHSIVQDGTQLADSNKDITAEQFNNFVEYARYLEFETITTQELLDFLTINAPIPPRSMMIIVDDRRPGLIRDWLMPVLEKYNWTATAAYIADPNSLLWAWDLMDQLNALGRLDVQSHGYTGQLYIVPESPVDQIQNEIWNSTVVLEEHFGKRPIAFIWPGGNFTPLSVQIARLGGYELGFSAYSRGPLLFNWVPLGEEERTVNDPLMVLPRAWSSAVNVNLDEAMKISEQAAAFAEQNYTAEAAWYSTYCGGDLSKSR